jgi:hypothetical protein
VPFANFQGSNGDEPAGGEREAAHVADEARRFETEMQQQNSVQIETTGGRGGYGSLVQLLPHRTDSIPHRFW